MLKKIKANTNILNAPILSEQSDSKFMPNINESNEFISI